MKNILLLFIGMLFVVACKNQEATPNEENPNVYGELLSAGPVVDFTEMVTRVENEGEIDKVKIKATVESVCQKKGCWMNIVSGDASDKPVFVRFKDYGFFVPKDLAGQEVIIEGRAFSEETSVEDLRHYAEDEGKSEEEIAAITEPAEELKFMATGVEIIR